MLGLLWLWFGVVHAAMLLDGGWREVRPGDTPAAVLEQFRQGQLAAFDPSLLHSFPREGSGTWVVLRPQPPWVDEERVLTIYPPALGRITVFDGEGPISTLALDQAGGGQPLGHGRLAFRYPASVPASTLILLRLEPVQGLSPPLSFHLESLNAFLGHDAHWLTLFSACFAVMLAMALMALCFALMLRDNTFSWYAGYIFCYALIQSIQTGFLFHPLEATWLAPSASLLESAGIALSVAFAALFMTRFCELQRFAPLLRAPVLALAIGMPLLALMRSTSIGLLVDVSQALVDPLLILGALLMLLTAIVAASHGSRHAWFFLVGWTPLLALTALSTAQLSGALPGMGWISDASVVAGAFEAIVLSIGLGDRALTMRRDRDMVRALADNDSLTGVLNRRAWSEGAEALLEESTGRPVALLFLDLDRFKLLNDQQGHRAGDHALIEVAEALRAELRPSDLLGRYGGEEFIAMLDGVVQEQAMQVATRLCRRVHRLEIPVNQEFMLSVSIGVAMRTSIDTVEMLIERADQAMYQAKVSGRNQARLYDRPPGITDQAWPRVSEVEP
ncbi:GGDEF domain-containing protein [Frateuria hangzhouensis]|uniref:GGDEF domain-containing protein n=1 Tax=Frateuria hangzhouensis TaxID=2995589 RepID=UPI002260C395|nr:diguanylate cyclase [Frateuria sp. STR12]MCX7512497.1 GGDEF domain-containing protein [Frateuria sp. STR12]